MYSVFNNEQCRYPSGLVHEISHNLKLKHAWEGSNEYGDQSGAMGMSYNQDDGPMGAKLCFNPAKSWQLGWYASKSEQVFPLTAPWMGNLVGVANYDENMSESVILELEGTQTKYYIGFNHASGFNEGTVESINQVTIVSQTGSGAESLFVARLGAGESYVIQNYLNSGKDTTIKVVQIETDSFNGFASVKVYSGDVEPEPARPTQKPSLEPVFRRKVPVNVSKDTFKIRPRTSTDWARGDGRKRMLRRSQPEEV